MHGGLCYNKFINLQGDSRHAGSDIWAGIHKINSLVKKGYVERIQSTTDKREYRLRPTQKYIDYYNISYSYLHLVMERAKQRFSPDDLAKLEEMLQIVSDELMPEIQLPK